jgi:chaperonin GroES
MKLELFDDRLMVLPEAAVTKTASGIILAPKKDKEFPGKGLVKLVSEDERVKSIVQVGDTVVFDKYAGEDVVLDGVLYRVLNRGDLMAVIKAEAK